MDFSLNKEQTMIKDAVERLMHRHYTFAQRDTYARGAAGWSEAMWQRYSEVGLLGLFDSDVGGPVEAMIVMEAFGHSLVLEPFLAAVLLCGRAVQRAGGGSHAELLQDIAAGRLLMAFAHTEPSSRYELSRVATRATCKDRRWILSGAKSAIMHGDCARRLLVSARVAGEPADPSGIGLFLIDAGSAGVRRTGYTTQDGLRAADLVLDRVEVVAADVLGPPGAMFPLIQELADVAIAATAAEAVGAMQALHDMTVAYLKTRRQFGVAIGTFQALQHRCVDMLVELEQARSMALYAAMMASEPDARSRSAAMSAVKVQITKSSRYVAQQAIQLHGGIGMTTEYAASHYFLRLMAMQARFGDGAHHLNALASIDGREVLPAA
ncbi:acyl-CoA dehydrogenase family protein [Bradyrhizobium sp. LHD-71]|uniref:acyl-CoA dehydrogenase family protein n=1 Tax=Bradyrhizobium sp. LHD-71 TaxID=3072141 RepID=UPI00280E4166|nr:acyl-CoA dehydrogenase family protein [Bradyrhizobium sp. LHD-71]MDQ8727414.1 acyl-CoA dehydrogenase family protein [Bradyrhizobium sp. LHD-71]